MKQAKHLKTNQKEGAIKQVALNTFIHNPFDEMKKLTSIILVTIIALVFASCEGPIGPVGPPGENGGLEYATIHEIEGDFTSGNGYSLGFQFPNGIYDTDVVLVYILWDVVDGYDVWRLCPQTIVIEDENPDESGVIQYNFDYTYVDVQIFMEFTVPENTLRPAETENQVFRIAVVPADFAALKSVDVNDINTILQAPNLQLKVNEKIELETIPAFK